MGLDKFGRAVRAIRFMENILLYDMAKTMNLSSAELSGIECGRKPIPDWFIPKLVEKYESAKDMEELLQKGAKERISSGFWCEEQGLDENKTVICMAHLAEGRVLDCPYKNNADRMKAYYPCSDYKERRAEECEQQ